jgi:hypothetical protein
VLASLRGLPPEAHLFIRLELPECGGEELDFLVLHPELGLVVVEVQEARAEPGLETPLEPQLEPSLERGSALARKQYQLQDYLKLTGKVPPITRVLALPGLPVKPGQAMGPDLPAWRLVGQDKLRQPLQALREAVAGGRPWASWRGLDRDTHPDLTPDQVLALVERLTPLLLPLPALEELLAAEGGAQDAMGTLFDHLAHNFSQGRYRVRGAAGSGKSLLGRKVVRLWAAEGRKVLVLASAAGGGMLEDLVQDRQALVATVRDLALGLLDGARALPPDGADLAAALGRAIPAIRVRWDALVLDDVQALEPGWVEPLLALLRDPARDPVLALEGPAPGRSSDPMPGQLGRLD